MGRRESSELDEFDDDERSIDIEAHASNNPALSRFCLPDRWLAVIGLVLTYSLLLGIVVFSSLPPKASSKSTATGNYPANAPFIEVITQNFPDPALLQHNGTWYVYASNSAAGIINSKLHGGPLSKNLGNENVQVATSDDFVTWKVQPASTPGGSLPELGEWVNGKMMPAAADSTVSVPRANVWAPDVIQRPSDGKFVLYYSATASGEQSIHCIGASVASSPLGPFTPEAKSIACPIAEGGAIDTAPFVDDDGTLYITYKLDGNARGHGGECLNTVPPLKNTPIFLQKMQDDGISTVGSPVTILDRTADDGPLVEAPSLIRTDEGIYILFFSTGCTFDPSYKLKYATATNLMGPYTRAEHTLLQTDMYGLLAPGSASVRREEKEISTKGNSTNSTWRMAFHARKFTDDVGGIRPMYVSNLKITGKKVELVRPE